MEVFIDASGRLKDRTRRGQLFLLGLAAALLLGAAAATALLPPDASRLAPPLLLGLLWVAASSVFMVVREARLPAMVFHSVADDPAWMLDTHLSLPAAAFARILDGLAARGYRTATVDEALGHLRGERPLPRGRIVLTFDDGFRDAWCVVAPLLAERGMSGVLFAPTDFVEDHAGLRPTLADARAGRCRPGEVDASGYASWDELRALDASGVLEVEGHTASHTWLEVGEQPLDFYRPGDQRFFVQWNAFPADKCRWHETRAACEERLLGRPVFETARAHAVRRAFLPEPELALALNDAVRSGGGAEFFDRPDWEARLRRRSEDMCRPAGRWETDGEAEARLDREYAGARHLLEEQLGRPVRLLCWPGDRCDAELERRSLDSGYQATTWVDGYNLPGCDTRRLYRTYVPFVHPGKGPQWLSVLAFRLGLGLYEGNYFLLFPYLAVCVLIRRLNARRSAP